MGLAGESDSPLVTLCCRKHATDRRGSAACAVVVVSPDMATGVRVGQRWPRVGEPSAFKLHRSHHRLGLGLVSPSGPSQSGIDKPKS